MLPASLSILLCPSFRVIRTSPLHSSLMNQTGDSAIITREKNIFVYTMDLMRYPDRQALVSLMQKETEKRTVTIDVCPKGTHNVSK